MSVIIPSSPIKYTAPGARCWTMRRKAELVEQVLDGEITLQSALMLHDLSADEFSGWVSQFQKNGYSALKQPKRRSTPSRRRAYGVARAIAILRTVTGAA